MNINIDKPVTTPFTKGKKGRPRKTLLEVMADIDEKNPTKPGQFTGKPVPLYQKVRKTKKTKPIMRKTVVRKPQRPIGDPFAFISQDIFTGRGRTGGTFDVKITADTVFAAKKILPQINEWGKDKKRIKNGKKVKNGFTYNSNNNLDWMTKSELKIWIKKNKDYIGKI